MQFIFLESAKGKFCVVWGSCQSVCREFNLKLYACLTNQGDNASLFPSFSFRYANHQSIVPFAEGFI